jgi:hypothetical protein
MRFTRHLADCLAGKRHDLLGTLLVALPGLNPLVIKRALLRERNQRLIAPADIIVILDDTGQSFFDRLLVLRSLGQQVLAHHVAIGDDAGAQFAEYADAWQPDRRYLDRIGVDGPHAPDGEQPHTGQHQEQEGHDSRDLRESRTWRT